MIKRVVIWLLVLVIEQGSASSGETSATETVAQGPTTCDSMEKKYNDTEIMDGKCVRGYFRNDYYDNELEDSEKFQYLVDNYCANLQSQPISCRQYRERKTYDEKALEMYKELYHRYQDGVVKPTVDCLGIARVVFCAHQFMYCNPEDGSESQVVCQFLCDTWLDRCPESGDLYTLMCSNTRGDRCSQGISRMMVLIGLMVVLY